MNRYWACRRWFRDYIFEPIWYRIFGHKFHIIKTGLKPCPWIEAEDRMLYGVMAIVEWFVENDMMSPTKEEYEEEVERINREDPEDYKQNSLDRWKDQYDKDCKIMAMYLWWKTYKKREQEILDALDESYIYENNLRENPDDPFGKFKPMTEEQEKEKKRLSDRYRELRERLEKEEQEYLKMAIDLRHYMWT